MRKKGKKKSFYLKSLFAFAILLVILGLVFLVYVTKSLITYENSDQQIYMDNLITKLEHEAKKDNLEKYVTLNDIKNNYEKKPSLNKGYAELLKNAKAQKIGQNEYKITSEGGKDLFKVTLDDSKTVNVLLILSYIDFDIKEIKPLNDKGLYNLEFDINNNETLFINDIKVQKEDIKALKAYQQVKDLVNVPVEINVNNLTYKPKVEIKDENNKVVSYTEKDGKYYSNSYYMTDNFDDAKAKLRDNFNPLEVAENYSLFLTSDNLTSGKRVSFDSFKENLIENTDIYDNLYKYATGVDRTFMSFHSNDKETFTNEKMSNFVIFSKDAFCVDVYLEKNMTLIDKQRRTDVLSETLYFVYYDNSYRLVYKVAKEGEK